MRIKFALLIMLVFLLAGCGGDGGEATPAVAAAAESPAPGLTPFVTESTPLAVLVMPADTPRALYDEYQELIYDMARSNGMRFQVLNTLTMEDLQLAGESLKVVIVFPPAPDLASLAAAAPQAQFLAIGIPEVSAGGNLSTISSTAPLDQQSFVAGYTAAMLAEDYRVGILYINDDPDAVIARQGFLNGYSFYCGLCRQEFPPYYDYPYPQGIPPTEPESYYPAYAEALLAGYVEVVYLYPPVASADVIDRLATYDVIMIGAELPLSELGSHWVMSIQAQPLPAIQAALPELVAGRGGQAFPTPLRLGDINPDLLSEGRQRLVQQLIDDLAAGFVSTGVTP
ncbi:MAG: hypothetical protein JXB85_11705 [Anaerolineales bacterium]|nr:hypothetical protein [Anaerolineales bacterium]